MKAGGALREEGAAVLAGTPSPHESYGGAPCEKLTGSEGSRRLPSRFGRGVAQPGSAPALGAGGPQFKSGRPDIMGERSGRPRRIPGEGSSNLPVAQLDRAAAF